jgi:carbon storage regulator
MLVLRRRPGEAFLIGNEVEVEILAVTQQGAKIGIRAPKETIVLRKELKITQDQNAMAASSVSLKNLERIQKNALLDSRIDSRAR